MLLQVSQHPFVGDVECRDRCTEAACALFANLFYCRFYVVNDSFSFFQVLHNPVTLKLQEEEEEQLLAQFVLPPLAVNYCNVFLRYYIACAADAKFLILYATTPFLQCVIVTFCADTLS